MRNKTDADLALGALFAASHATHHALADLETLLGHEGPANAQTDAAEGSILRLRGEASRGLEAVAAAAAAFGLALFGGPLERGSRPGSDPGPLTLAHAVTHAHETLTELVSSWHAVTDGEKSLAEFGAMLGVLVAKLAQLECRIRP